MCYTLIVSFRTIYALPCVMNEDSLGKDRGMCEGGPLPGPPSFVQTIVSFRLP